MDALTELVSTSVRERLDAISQTRERLIEAWIAETGVLPSESVQVVQTDINGTMRISIVRRTDADIEAQKKVQEYNEKISLENASASPERWGAILFLEKVLRERGAL